MHQAMDAYNAAYLAYNAADAAVQVAECRPYT
jgi:hypothetical protein